MHKGWRDNVDLHLHSRYSDGSENFQAILFRVKLAGIDTVSFTDHDTTESYQAAKPIADRLGIKLIPGIEISAYDFKRKRKVHLLGYDYREEALHIKALCDPLLKRRNKLSEWQLEQLIDHNYDFVENKMLKTLDTHKVMYKQHIMAMLTANRYSSEAYQDLYRTLFKEGGICEGEIEYIDVFQAAEAIKNDWGLVVVAHAGEKNSYEVAEELAEKDLLDGIEKFHPEHDEKDYEKIDELANKFHLFLTGGSDYHGIFGMNENLGYVKKV